MFVGARPLSSSEDRQLLVIGGGIAGASAAYFAARAGWTVILIDAAAHRASDVPVALLDPVRGRSGRLDPRALNGLRLTWELIGQLEQAGHPLPHEQRGVLRVLPSDLVRGKFDQHLPPDLPHRWLSATPETLRLGSGWPHLLFLPEAGWVSGPALVAALVATSGATVRVGRAGTWDDRSVTLEDGERLQGQAVLWCGGSAGASWGGGAGQSAGTDTHRGGSLLLLSANDLPYPVSSGVYLSPGLLPGGVRGTVLGATFDAPTRHPNASGPSLKSMHWLLERAAALSADLSPTVTGLWSGSRLSGERLGRQPGGWWSLAGLGSKGFLLGPLLARETVALLGADLEQSGGPGPGSSLDE